jgi:hypothetical protein
MKPGPIKPILSLGFPVVIDGSPAVALAAATVPEQIAG